MQESALNGYFAFANKPKSVNTEMRAISALIHLNYDMIDGRNRNQIKSHFTNIIRYGNKYDRINVSYEKEQTGDFPLSECCKVKMKKWDKGCLVR